MKNDDFLNIIKGVVPDFDEEIVTTGFIDTGCYILNAAVSGSIYGGIADNRVTQLVGDPGSGKTFVAMTVVKAFLEEHPTGRALYFDTEHAVDREFFRKRGIDGERIFVVNPETLEDFHTKMLNLAEGIEKQKPKDRVPVIMVLDSLGNLPSMKELQDAKDGKNVRDMTKQGTIRSIFRTATQKLGKLAIPLVVANHSYQVIGCVPSGTPITMADGSVKTIENVEVGDFVLTMDGEREATELFKYEVTETFQMEMEDGTIIEATPNHKFLTTTRGWVRIDELTTDDEIVEMRVD